MVRYCAVSSIDHSHKAPVADLQWLPDHMEVGHNGQLVVIVQGHGYCCTAATSVLTVHVDRI